MQYEHIRRTQLWRRTTSAQRSAVLNDERLAGTDPDVVVGVIGTALAERFISPWIGVATIGQDNFRLLKSEVLDGIRLPYSCPSCTTLDGRQCEFDVATVS